MLNEGRGQISLEYLIIFTVSLILLCVFTLPLLEFEIENTLDISDTLKMKSDIFKLSSAISQVYSEGQGCKQTVIVQLDNPIRINVGKNYLSCNLKLNDNSKKLIKSSHKSNLDASSISLREGRNIVIIDWPVGSEKMNINVLK